QPMVATVPGRPIRHDAAAGRRPSALGRRRLARSGPVVRPAHRRPAGRLIRGGSYPERADCGAKGARRGETVYHRHRRTDGEDRAPVGPSLMPPSLSALLVQREAAPMRAVEEAIARQVLHGGDLATNLLELSGARENVLLAIVAECQARVAIAPGRIPMPPAH